MEKLGNCKVNYEYLRPLKAKDLKQTYEKGLKRNDAFVRRFTNATMCHDFGGLKIFDENGRFVYYESNEQTIEKCLALKSEFVDKKVVYCGVYNGHYGHLLVQSSVCLWYTLLQDDTVDNYVFFSENKELPKGNIKEFFDILGVTDKLLFVSKPTRFREMIVPGEAFSCWHGFGSEKFCEMLDEMARRVKIDAKWKTFDKVYLSRCKSGYLSIVYGEKSIEEFYKNNGYQIVYPETITLSHLIYILQNAKEIAVISGSLHHNVLFAKNGTKVTIIEREAYNNFFQVCINQIKNLDVTYVDANFCIYPMLEQNGPFVVSCLGKLQDYAKDNDMNMPDEKFLTERYIRKCVRWYMKNYHKLYGFNWFTLYPQEQMRSIEYLYEAYDDSENYLRKYLSGQYPYKFSQYFKLLYFRRALGRTIRKVKNLIKT